MKKIVLALFLIPLLTFSCSSPGIAPDSTSQAGGNSLDGSYASIIPTDKYVYAINRSELITFKKTEAGLERIDKQEVGFGVENIFYFEGNLFIGSESGMYIYSITESGVPSRQNHTSYGETNVPWQGPCDPVIVHEDVAYVTLNSTRQGRCSRSSINQLRLYDVKDIKNPSLLSITEMIQPKGLGKKDAYLYVCEGSAGVSVMDVSDSKMPKKIATISGLTAHDLIINGNKLAVVGPKEIKQYDISNVNDITLYSTINLK